jgi:predicted lipid-binding transport protein (Tim44 family)
MSVFVVLGLIWAAVLVPPVLRARSGRRAEFIDSFRAQMGALDSRRAKAAELSAQRSRRKASPAQRRRDVLGGMLGALIGSLVLGAFPSLRMVWVLHLFLLNVFLGYVALLAHQRQVTERRQGPMAATPTRGPAARRARPARRPSRALEPALHSR